MSILKTKMELMVGQQKAANLFPNTNNNILSIYGGAVLWNTDNLEDYINKGFAKNAAIYSVIKRIAKTAAIAPFKVFKVKDEEKHAKYKAWTGENATPESLQRAMSIKELVYEEDNDHPLNKLLDRPNEWQRGNEFTENSIGFKLLTGNRFLKINALDAGANFGKPYSVYNLPPQYMKIFSDGTLFGVAAYALLMGKEIPLQKEEVIHSKYPNYEMDLSGSHLWGLSPLRANSKNNTRLESALQRSTAMLQNAGAAGLVFEKNRDGVEAMSLEAAGQLKHKINTEVLGTQNAGKIAIANGDMGYINFGLNATEMAILDLEKYSLQMLCSVYQVPYILFSNDSSTYNNIKEAKKELLTMACIPELAGLRDDWNEIGKAFGDRYIDYDLSFFPELQEDLEKTSKIVNNWWYTGNEKRLAMGLDEDNDQPMMDTYLVPAGLQKIDDIGMPDIEQDLSNQGLNDYDKPERTDL